MTTRIFLLILTLLLVPLPGHAFFCLLDSYRNRQPHHPEHHIHQPLPPRFAPPPQRPSPIAPPVNGYLGRSTHGKTAVVAAPRWRPDK